MEDSFKVRVDKAFGSLPSDDANTPSPSLWCLTDDEIHKPQTETLNPKSKDNGVFFFTFPNQTPRVTSENHQVTAEPEPELDADIEEEEEEDLNDDESDDDRKLLKKVGGSSQLLRKPDVEEWDIRSSIGFDSTLDFEEEEDEYDRVAIGMEKDGDCLYISNVTDCGNDIASYNELPFTHKDFTRESQANFMAAKSRLVEDAEASREFVCLRVSDNNPPRVVNTQNDNWEDGAYHKSILKRKENKLDKKSQKRVRSKPPRRVACEEESKGAKDVAMENFSVNEATMSKEASFVTQDSSGIPDYVRNPLRYTHYTFDSSTAHIDEESNKKAYTDFINLIRRSNTSEPQPDEPCVVLPKSITFNRRKKPTSNNFTMENGIEVDQNQLGVCKEIIQEKSWHVSAIEAVVESEVCAMEEDGPEIVVDKTSNSQRQGRQYRTKAKIESDEH